MQEKEDELEEWKLAKVVFGRLIKIDKERKTITIETREFNPINPEQPIWISHEYTIKTHSDTDINDLRAYLGEDIELTVEDAEVIKYETK